MDEHGRITPFPHPLHAIFQPTLFRLDHHSFPQNSNVRTLVSLFLRTDSCIVSSSSAQSLVTFSGYSLPGDGSICFALSSIWALGSSSESSTVWSSVDDVLALLLRLLVSRKLATLSLEDAVFGRPDAEVFVGCCSWTGSFCSLSSTWVRGFVLSWWVCI